MGRRDRDERPPVEPWTASDQPAEVERVQLGGAGRGRRGGVVALMAVAALFAAGLLTRGSEEPQGTAEVEGEERDNSARNELKPQPGRRPATTTTRPPGPTTSRPGVPGPVLGELTGGSILVLAAQGRWTWVDLDTGTRGELDVRGVGEPYGSVPVRGGLVVVERSGQASLRRLPGGESTALGPAELVLRGGLPDQVWLVRWLMDGSSISARLVDLDGNELVSLELPVPWAQWGGTSGGLPFSVGGRTYFVDADGVRPLTSGELLGTAARGIIVLTCDDEARCAPERVDLETGRVVRLGDSGDWAQGGFVVPGGPGDVAVVRYGGVASLAWYRPDGRQLGTVELPLLSHQELAWLPGDLGLLVPTAGGFQRAYLDGGGGVTLERLDGLTAPNADSVFLINP